MSQEPLLCAARHGVAAPAAGSGASAGGSSAVALPAGGGGPRGTGSPVRLPRLQMAEREPPEKARRREGHTRALEASAAGEGVRRE
jgi:hypothetical protein